MNKKIVLILIVLDLFWCIAALIYDLPAIKSIPFYSWPFIAICPIFPLLLAIVWYKKVLRRNTNSYLIAFAAIPSAAYFIGALIYYPTLMSANGFNWLNFGSIFWVAFYGLQGFYLLIANKLSKIPQLLAILFLVISFIIQYIYRTFGYLNLAGLSNQVIMIIYTFTLINLMIYIFVLKKLRFVLLKLKKLS